MSRRTYRKAVRKTAREQKAANRRAQFGPAGKAAPVIVKTVDGEGRKARAPRSEYERYLMSRKWRGLRLAVLERDKRKCVVCGYRRNLQVHHETYERIYNERLEDLVTLCGDCHRDIHRRVAA